MLVLVQHHAALLTPLHVPYAAAALLCSQVIAIMKVYEPLNLFLKAAFNGYSYGENCEPKCIGDNYGAYQYLNDDVQRGIYIWFFMPEKAEGDGGYIHPLPLQILVAGKSELMALPCSQRPLPMCHRILAARRKACMQADNSLAQPILLVPGACGSLSSDSAPACMTVAHSPVTQYLPARLAAAAAALLQRVT